MRASRLLSLLLLLQTRGRMTAQQLASELGVSVRTVYRDVEALGLVLKAGIWYVVARCHGAMRTYRVDQIAAATLCECGFTAEPGFELASYWHSYLAEFYRQLYTGHAVIRLSGAGVRRMRHL